MESPTKPEHLLDPSGPLPESCPKPPIADFWAYRAQDAFCSWENSPNRWPHPDFPRRNPRQSIHSTRHVVFCPGPGGSPRQRGDPCCCGALAKGLWPAKALSEHGLRRPRNGIREKNKVITFCVTKYGPKKRSQKV